MYFLHLLLMMSLQNSTLPEHPFTPCPETPNCVIETHSFNLSSELLYQTALIVLGEHNTFELQYDENALTLDAVFRIPLFGFKDDVKITIQGESDDLSKLHIKSASRTGYSDLGVNQRRINRIIKELNKKLS